MAMLLASSPRESKQKYSGSLVHACKHQLYITLLLDDTLLTTLVVYYQAEHHSLTPSS